MVPCHIGDALQVVTAQTPCGTSGAGRFRSKAEFETVCLMLGEHQKNMGGVRVAGDPPDYQRGLAPISQIAQHQPISY